MAPIKLEDTCIMCPRRGVKKCGGCKEAQYCSKECQVLDWKVYKMLCSSINEPSPGLEYRRVILFPAEGQQPRLEWIKVWEVGVGEGKYEEWDRKPYFGDDPVERYSVCRNNIQARNTFDDDQDGIHIWISGNACMKSRNEAVRAVTRAGVCAYCWKGPILAMRRVGQEDGIQGYIDYTARDLRSIADFFSSAWRKSQYDNADKRVLSCMKSSDSMVDRGIPEYKESALDQANSVFSNTGSSIANLLRIPLLIEATSLPELAQMMPGLTSDSHNPLAEMLVRDINSVTTGSQDSCEHQQARSEAAATFGDYYNQIADQYRFPSGEGGFGTSPVGWNKPPVGPIMVVRADGKPLLSVHLKAICEYVKQKVEPRLQEAIHGLVGGAYVEARERVLDSVTKADFLTFWSTHEVARGANGGSTSVLPSPYELQGHTLERLNARTESLFLRNGIPTAEVRRLQPGGSGGPIL